MPPPERPQVLYGFFCEHVRDEVGGTVTAIGLWGDQCRILGQAPQVIPFAFHAYIRNRAGLKLPLEVSLRIPGATPIDLNTMLKPSAGSVGTNVIVNLGMASFVEPGRVVARVSLGDDVREFSVEVLFEPPVTTPSPA